MVQVGGQAMAGSQPDRPFDRRPARQLRVQNFFGPPPDSQTLSSGRSQWSQTRSVRVVASYWALEMGPYQSS
jgi:hypothetical protein